MCGITGLLNCGDEQVLSRMVQVISHRGPDDHGIKWFNDYNSGIGHRRLSIIDLSSSGHQPMTNENERFWITYNGEIFNFKEIRRKLLGKGYKFISNSDTEVLLKAYEEWDYHCLSKLNGMFVFAILDTVKKKLFLARDRMGIKPLYYFHNKDKLIFASEIKAILSSGLVERREDTYALKSPARFQISPYTGFENIFKLRPGHYIEFENGVLNEKQYWSIKPTEDNLISYNEAKEKLDYLIQDSVSLQMISDVQVGVLLSGGLDSSLISALMKKNNNDIYSFTIKFKDEDQRFEKSTDDSYYAKKLADNLNFIHKEIIIEPNITELLPKLIYHMDEPLSDPASINTYLISKAARENGIVVLLNGMGGDEIFGGYRKHLACIQSDIYQHIFPKGLRKVLENYIKRIPVASINRGYKNIRWLKRFISFASLPEYERYLSSDLSMNELQFVNIYKNSLYYKDSYFFKEQSKYFEYGNISYLTKMCLNDSNIFLPEHNLTYSDKSSMAIGVEGRPPLTDHRIVEFMFSLPPSFRIKGSTQKYLLKKVAEKYLPKEIIYRPKASFGSPLRSWIKGPLKMMVDDILSEESLKKRNLYNPNYVHQLIENDRRGIEDNSLLIWTLLTNEIWYKTFFN